MSIICLEGPSAVGKTTISQELASQGAYVVPEVNALFTRPKEDTPTWYVERQVERWQIARQESHRHPLVVLDGDPFQPLWYNWAYRFVGWQDLDALEGFYRPYLVRRELNFPDRYFLLKASIENLRLRKAGDLTRQRRRFETHLQFIAPQRRYFLTMQSLAPERVTVLDAQSVADSVHRIKTMAVNLSAEKRPVDIFDMLVQWLRTHSAAEFPSIGTA